MSMIAGLTLIHDHALKQERDRVVRFLRRLADEDKNDSLRGAAVMIEQSEHWSKHWSGE